MPKLQQPIGHQQTIQRRLSVAITLSVLLGLFVVGSILLKESHKEQIWQDIHKHKG